MAKVEFKGIDEVVTSLTELSELPDEVIDAMLNARADVVVKAQRAEARKLGTEYRNKGQKKNYATGMTANSIRKGKVKVKDGQRVLYITPVGSRKRGKTFCGKRTNKARTPRRRRSLRCTANTSKKKGCRKDYHAVRSKDDPVGAVRRD